MAISKIKALHNTLGKAISYIIDPDKTEGGSLVSSYGCSAATAAIEMKLTADQGRKIGNRVGYHLFQSFSPEDGITPEKAHELGKEFADKMLKGKYEYVIATHVDRDHIHNHIILNSTSFYNHGKYHYDKKETLRMRTINDEICRENNLSVIENNSGIKGRGKYEYAQSKAGKSWKDTLRHTIDKAIEKSGTFEEFLEIMKMEGYKVNQGRRKYMTFKTPKGNTARSKSLGDAYTEERIKKRIENLQLEKIYEKPENETLPVSEEQYSKAPVRKTEIQENVPKKDILETEAKGKKHTKPSYKTDKKRINLIIDISKNVKAQQSHAYGQALTRSNINTLIKTMNFLTSNNIQTAEEFNNYYSSISAEYEFLRKDVKQYETNLIGLSEKIKFAQDYKKYHNLYYAAMRAGEKAKFYVEHQNEITAFKASCIYFKKSGENPDAVNLKNLFEEYRLMKEDRFITDMALKNSRKRLKELNVIKKNVEDALGIKLIEKEESSPEEKNAKNKRKADIEL